MRKVISIVTPCFNEEDGIRECWETIRDLFKEHLPDYEREHIFCDNASTDRTVEILKEIAAEDPGVRIIVNSRNFGILRNTFNGVVNANGDATVLFMPADMQDPPELIPEMVKLWESGYEIVYGIRAQRQESLPLRSMRKAYYRVLSAISEVEYPPDVGDYQLVDRVVLDQLKSSRTVQPFLRMMTFEAGFKAVGLPYTWRVRKHGLSRNRVWQLIDQAFIGLISHSNAPLRLAILLGTAIAALSFAYVCVVILLWAIYDNYAPTGTFTTISAIFFFGGVQLAFTGVVGEYVGAIFNQVRGRPLVVERERINFRDSADGPD